MLNGRASSIAWSACSGSYDILWSSVALWRPGSGLFFCSSRLLLASRPLSRVCTSISVSVAVSASLALPPCPRHGMSSVCILPLPALSGHPSLRIYRSPVPTSQALFPGAMLSNPSPQTARVKINTKADMGLYHRGRPWGGPQTGEMERIAANITIATQVCTPPFTLALRLLLRACWLSGKRRWHAPTSRKAASKAASPESSGTAAASVSHRLWVKTKVEEGDQEASASAQSWSKGKGAGGEMAAPVS